ncbi:MAG: cob(I)yrinic acid a,c-diamide adenosyltransferase [Calditrichaeota bacterium]|nr:cob(I)yrinic acid a,c-diamide adenosyltransferase [Calditrichota bacterium]RQW01930.1 MAG: cob(I)yrinic acid a,c-diamide adenosyltransferase [Calditrichota bacterium]
MPLKAVPRNERQGLLIVYTGNGKGKTTAALGMVVRAIGYNWRILMVQFIKGDWMYGELEGYKKLAPNFDLERMGKGFVRIMGDKRPIEDHIQAAKNALNYVRKKMAQDYDIVILDEVNVAIREGLLTVEEVMEVIKNRPRYVTMILTGRNAAEEIIEAADLVTEMTEIKHPFQSGLMAQPGIDY